MTMTKKKKSNPPGGDGISSPSPTKRKYPRYSQDFSAGGKTDASFAPACDVNDIVKRYERTGSDPFLDRKQNQRFGVASTVSYEQAMRAQAEIASAFAHLPLSERLRYDHDPHAWFEDAVRPEPVEELSGAPEPPQAELFPEGATDDEKEGQ